MKKKPSKQTPQMLRSLAEEKLAHSPPMKAPATQSTEQLLHELQVHQIELEMQNESLRQAQIALEESRDRYADLYDFSPAGYLTLTCEALITEINLTGAALLGEDRKKLINRRFARLINPDDTDRWHRTFLRVALHGGQQRCELGFHRADGSHFQAQLDLMRVDRTGSDPVVRIVLTDITERKRAEEELRIAAITFESQSGVMVTNPDGVILRVNRAFTQLTGYSPEEAVGHTPELLKSGRHDKAFYQAMWKAIKQNGYWQGVVWNRHKNGKIYANWEAIFAITAPDGSVSHYVSSYFDITKNPEAEAEAHRLAYHDPLTQLPNRRLLKDRIVQAMAAAAHSGLYGAVLFLDLDNFKVLNDTRGHDVGDLLLIEVAQRLRSCVRGEDSVARFGGDEFVIVLEDLSNEADEAAAQAKVIGGKVQNVLAHPYHIKGHNYHFTSSIGVKLFRDNTATIEEVLKHADLAMYQSKNEGRNTLRFYDPAVQIALDERSALASDLRKALDGKQFRLFFQPQIENLRGVIGVEALLRWDHPERGLILPGEFISLAEESGLILPIGHWVLQEACSQIKKWESNPQTRGLHIAINVSARQFHQPDFIEKVKQVLASSGANPSNLEIELTESLVISDVVDTIFKIKTLKNLGVVFSMDDFGTGYSSLSYLTQLPLDQLKIDRSFISTIGSDFNSETIVQTIITLGNALKMDVIAEGVETEVQREFLGRNVCHLYQGFLFSRPLPLAEFEQYLALTSRQQAARKLTT